MLISTELIIVYGSSRAVQKLENSRCRIMNEYVGEHVSLLLVGFLRWSGSPSCWFFTMIRQSDDHGQKWLITQLMNQIYGACCFDRGQNQLVNIADMEWNCCCDSGQIRWSISLIWNEADKIIGHYWTISVLYNICRRLIYDLLGYVILGISKVWYVPLNDFAQYLWIGLLMTICCPIEEWWQFLWRSSGWWVR